MLLAARTLVLALALAYSCAGAAADAKAQVLDPRIRLLPGDLPLAGYFELRNKGAQPLELVGASSPAFASIEMHLSVEQNGTETMMPLDNVEVRPGGSVPFAPGGRHLMMMGRKARLRIGDEVSVTFRFSDGASLDAKFIVRGAGTR